jgi:hypothetical protein
MQLRPADMEETPSAAGSEEIAKRIDRPSGLLDDASKRAGG